ncbi:hypothetical protein A4A49_60694 [Nicotiana attenuata]|uniref:Uncharacterized protein n=1 Tax=Nicotiana attenuata TaxID=49451 RepID=A0A1J6HV15_NICAT|nr:hypothetical protein A4A49_60694 [Nicotiana attenuata]
MSQGSSASFGSRKNCHCSMTANEFPATTPVNVGKRFSKCSKRKDNNLLDPRITDLISSLKCENDDLKRKKIVIQMMVANLDNILVMDVHEK